MKENRMQITEEARRAAAIAVAVEVNGWPGAASLPYHPTDPTVADTMRRLTDVALEAAVPLLAPPVMDAQTEHAVCNACGWDGSSTRITCPDCGSADVNYFTPGGVAPQSIVDREALGLVLDAHQLISDNGSEVGCSCGWTSTDSWRHGEHHEHQMDALLALLNGSES